MIKRSTLLKNLYKNTSLEKYAKYFYYGFDTEEWQNSPIGYHFEGLWMNKETIIALNNFQKYYEGKKADIFFFDKNKKDVNIMFYKQNKTSKLALLAAGGGFESVANAIEAMPVADYLYKKGFGVAMLTYSIKKEAYLESTTNDLINAIKFLSKNQNKLNIDMTDYLIGGFSAGGHVTARIISKNFGYKVNNLIKPGMLFLAYPVISFDKYSHSKSKELVIGKNPSKDLVDKYSLEKSVDESSCPVFIWQCDKDNNVPIQNSQLYVEALKKKNIKYIYKTYDSDAHGWSIANNTLADGWVNEMLKFYKQVTKNGK